MYILLLYINNAFPTGFSHRGWHRRLNLHLCGASAVTRGSLALRRALAGGGRVPRHPGDGGFLGGGGLIPKDPPKDPQGFHPKVSTRFPVSTGRNRSRRRALSHNEPLIAGESPSVSVCVTEAVGLFDAKATSTMQKAPGRRCHQPLSQTATAERQVKADVTRHRYGEPGQVIGSEISEM